MDEDITIINNNSRNEKIKNFLIKKKKLLVFIIIFLILSLIGFYSFQIYKDQQREEISYRYNSAIIKYENGDRTQIISSMNEIINSNNSTYSPLALYFLIDNDLAKNKIEINKLFDKLINTNSLDFEIKNLIIYKKALYNADTSDEKDMLKILNPLIKSESIWRSHALYLLAEYFYSRKENQKAKDFFNQILEDKNANQDLVKESQKRLNRDLSD